MGLPKSKESMDVNLVYKLSSVIPIEFTIDAILAISEEDSFALAPFPVENLSFPSEFPGYIHNTEHY